MLVALVPVSVLPVGASGHVAACSCCSKCWWLAPCRLAATQNAGFVDTGSITAVMMERCVPPVSPFLSPHAHFWHVGLLPSPGYQQHHWASSKPTGEANPGPPPPSGRRRPPLSFCFSPSNLSPPLADATTAAGWTTTPKSASSRRSPRNATSARASATWSPTARRKRSSPPARRESLPTSERRRTCTARPCSPKPGNDGRRRQGLPPGRRGFGKATGGHGGQEEGAGRGGGSPFSSPQPAFNWGGSKNGGGSARRTSCRGKKEHVCFVFILHEAGQEGPREEEQRGSISGRLSRLPAPPAPCPEEGGTRAAELGDTHGPALRLPQLLARRSPRFRTPELGSGKAARAASA